MKQHWLVIPTRGVAVDVDAFLPRPHEARHLEALTAAARKLHRDLTARISPRANPLAYTRLEGAGVERMAELRGVRLSELRTLAAELRSGLAARSGDPGVSRLPTEAEQA